MKLKISESAEEVVLKSFARVIACFILTTYEQQVYEDILIAAGSDGNKNTIAEYDAIKSIIDYATESLWVDNRELLRQCVKLGTLCLEDKAILELRGAILYIFDENPRQKFERKILNGTS